MSPARRARLLGVSLLALIGVGSILACLSAATSPIFDPDVHWLAAAGRELWRTGAIPTQNAFSFTAPNHPWLMHEWLLSPLYAWLLDRLGPSGMPLLAFASTLAMVVLQVALATRGRRHELASLLLLTFTVGAFSVLMASPRPTVVARLFPAALLWLVTRRRFGRASLLFAVVLEWVWANAHGSFPLGLVVLTVAALDAERDRRARWMALALAGCVTLLNPAGLALHGLALGYLVGGDETLALVHEHVREFSPAWVLLDDPWPLFELSGLLVVTLLALSALVHRRHLPWALFALVLCAMGVMQARHVMLAILLGGPALLPEVRSLLAERGRTLSLFPSRGDERGPRLGRRLTPLLVVPSAIIATIMWAQQRAESPPSAWIHESLGGESFARLASALPDHARTYTHFGVAGRLIWLGAPRGVRVFYDSRNDCYPPDVVREAFELADPDVAPARALRILHTRGTDFALIGPFGALGEILTRSDGWRVLARDGEWRLFGRAQLGLRRSIAPLAGAYSP